MDSNRLKQNRGGRLSAFTLVEMLVVIAIISILMTAGSIGLSGMGGKGVTSGVATAESLFDEARSIAVGKNLRSCVLVAQSLSNNHNDDLRRILIAYEEVDSTTGLPKTDSSGEPVKDPNWVLANRGSVLPEQTFFSSEFSSQKVGGSEKIDTISHSKIVGVKKAYEGKYFIYEFNSQGISNYNEGASFIIGSGARSGSKPGDTDLPKLTASAKRDFGGFVIWRNGRTSVFRSPDQMGAAVKALNTGDKF